MKIGDRIYVRGYIDEIRKDTVIVRNDGGYFGTVLSEVTGELPPAQPDLSSYSDKLWRNAYERGKAEAQAEIIRCRDCKYYREYGYVNGKPKFLPKCTFSSIYVNADDFCSREERRTDEKKDI